MNEPYHFFLSISAKSIIDPMVPKCPFIPYHLKEISKWTQEPHITLLGFNTYEKPHEVQASIAKQLLSCHIAPLYITINGYRGGTAPGQMRCLLIDKEAKKELLRLRKLLAHIVESHVVHKTTFKKYLNHLCPFFHIAVGRTMSPANLDTLASSLRGRYIEVDSLDLEIRQEHTVLDTTKIFIGMKEGEEPLYRLVYQT